MSRFTKLALGLSLLLASGATAFAGEGTYQPAGVASPTVGRAVDQGVGASFAFGAAEGGQAPATPASPARGAARGPAAVAFGFNAGLNG